MATAKKSATKTKAPAKKAAAEKITVTSIIIDALETYIKED